MRPEEAKTRQQTRTVSMTTGGRRRKPCLLNLLASLRVRPTLSAPLIEHVQSFYQIGTERAHAKVDREFLTRQEELASDPKKPFYREGRPKDSMHKKLIESIPNRD